VTLEHLYFIPIVFFLGIVAGTLLAQRRPPHTSNEGTGERRAVATRRVSGRAVLLPLLAFLLFFVVSHLLPMHGGPHALSDALGGLPIFDQRPSFSAAEVYARIAAFGPEGRAAYQKMTFTTDLVFPLVLLTFLVQLLRFLAERTPNLSPWRVRLAFGVPGLWFAADLAENAIIHHLLGVFPERHDSLAGALGAVTSIKFALLMLSAGTAAWLGVMAARSNGAQTHA
jgi:hypothetical protein